MCSIWANWCYSPPFPLPPCTTLPHSPTAPLTLHAAIEVFCNFPPHVLWVPPIGREGLDPGLGNGVSIALLCCANVCFRLHTGHVGLGRQCQVAAGGEKQCSDTSPLCNGSLLFNAFHYSVSLMPDHQHRGYATNRVMPLLVLSNYRQPTSLSAMLRQLFLSALGFLWLPMAQAPCQDLHIHVRTHARTHANTHTLSPPPPPPILHDKHTRCQPHQLSSFESLVSLPAAICTSISAWFSASEPSQTCTLSGRHSLALSST